jgi:hypothetical protein
MITSSVLLAFFVSGLFFAPSTKFLQFNSIRIVHAVFEGDIIQALAIGTCQINDNAITFFGHSSIF